MKHPKSIAKSSYGPLPPRTRRGRGRVHRQDQPDRPGRLNAPALSDGPRDRHRLQGRPPKLGDDGINLQAVGSGPFIFDQFQSGSQLIVNKNPNYWEKGLDGQPLPYLDRIHYRFVPDDSVRFTEMRSGSADIGQLFRGRDVPAIKADANLNYYEDPPRAGSTASSSTPRSRLSRTTSSCARRSSTPSTAMQWRRPSAAASARRTTTT